MPPGRLRSVAGAGQVAPARTRRLGAALPIATQPRVVLMSGRCFREESVSAGVACLDGGGATGACFPGLRALRGAGGGTWTAC